MEEKVINNADQWLRSLPKPFPVDLMPQIQKILQSREETIVVLDDDPTGTQTVYDIPVLTEVSLPALRSVLDQKLSLFYILTNSRSLPPQKAAALNQEICQKLLEASLGSSRRLLIVSRSDSTLRGHYPLEVEVLEETLGLKDALKVLIPAFFEGGRYTINDIHYVREGNTLTPASLTPFARDKAFGFTQSNLKKYIEEKSKGEIPADEVFSFSLEKIRSKGPQWVKEKLESLPPGTTCLVNAACYRDLEVFALGFYQANRPVLFRTAASVVPVLGGMIKKSVLSGKVLGVSKSSGILIVAGSYVPKTTAQLNALNGLPDLVSLEIEVEKVIAQPERMFNEQTEKLNTWLAQGKDVVVYTSRKLISHPDPARSLEIGNQVSKFLVDLVKHLNRPPKSIIAKGGITSSDIATQSLGVKKAWVLGQIAPGIPVWKTGPESKFPGMMYVVFPGNVGDDQLLKEVYLKLKGDR